MTRIVLVDDHPVVRQGIRTVLEAEPGWDVIGEAADGNSAIDTIHELQPDIAVVDVMLPGLNGLEIVRRITSSESRTRTVVLSMHADTSYVANAMQSGASAYVLKATSTTNLVHAIRESVAGRRYLSPPLSEDVVDNYVQRGSTAEQAVSRYQLLTRREREVFHLVLQGLSNNQIAQQFSISPRTVETHRANLMRKLNLETLSELHQYAYRNGLLSPE